MHIFNRILEFLQLTKVESLLKTTVKVKKLKFVRKSSPAQSQENVYLVTMQ